MSYITHISSTENPTIKLVRQLLKNHRQRKKQQLTILEGIHLIDAAMNANHKTGNVEINKVLLSDKLLATAHDSTNCQVTHELNQLLTRLHNENIDVISLPESVYKTIRVLGSGTDIIAITPIKKVELKTNVPATTINEDCLILNGVQNSGNVGTLLRTAAAIGIKHILCTDGTAQLWSPKTLRAGMGAHFNVTMYENLSVKQLLSVINVPILATSSHCENNIYQTNLNRPVAWVMGHEGQGICEEILTIAEAVSIPQPNGQESLNVSVAGSLCMYEMLRQRSYS